METTGVGIFEKELPDCLEIAGRYEVVSVFIYSKVDQEVLDNLPNLKMIATRSTGVDHIDIKECQKRSIVVANVPKYGENSVAEYAIAMMLSVAKKIVPAHQSVEEGEFSPSGLTGIDLYGKTLGVIGVGKIGQNVVRIARGIGMKVIAVERTPDPLLAKKLKFKYVSLEECLKNSDVVSIHVPNTPETHHLIKRNNIKLMKPGSILINTSRGSVVESEAIVYALNNKILRGAGLDVAEEEERVENISMVLSKQPRKEDLRQALSFHMLRDRDDVVFTPHNAFNTEEAVGRIIKTTVENINRFLKNGKL